MSFIYLLIAGLAISLGIGVASHFLVQHIIRRNQFTLVLVIPPLLLLLNAVVFNKIPVWIGRFYDAHLNSLPDPDVPGPLGTIGSTITLLCFVITFPLLCGYALYLASVLIGWFFGYRGEDV
jgi:hypothetical protein